MNRPKKKANLKKLKLQNDMESTEEARNDIDLQSAGSDYIDAKLTEADVKQRSRLLPRRTKLDDFVYKRPLPINDADDFNTPQKKLMPAAPSQKQRVPQVRQKKERHKHEKRKKQPSIKSALMRNELLFSEIVAQHALAENFSPNDMQLALMLSKSETEQVHNQHNEYNSNEQEHLDKGSEIRAQLQKYGFRAAPKTDYDEMAATFSGSVISRRRNKCKWANKLTALTLRNIESQLQKLQQRIEQVLQQCAPPKMPVQDVKHAYVPISAMLSKLLACESTACIKNETIPLKLNAYFVPDLFSVCQLPAGHLLKNWAAIPGREMSPKRIVVRELSSSEQYISSHLPKLASTLPQSSPSCLFSTNNVPEIVVVSATQSTTQYDELPMTYPNSPDIFENSMCEESEHEAAACKAVVTDNESEASVEQKMPDTIITYEIYSSDEDRSTEKPDLTQIDMNNKDKQRDVVNEIIEIPDEAVGNVSLIETVETSSPQHKRLRRNTSLPVPEQQDNLWEDFKIPEINTNKHKSRSMNELLSDDFSKCCLRRTQSVNLHNCTKQQEQQQYSATSSVSNLSERSVNSIDLTQTSSNDDSDDDLLMISDDEVNYSILKAKSLSNRAAEETQHVKNCDKAKNSDESDDSQSELDSSEIEKLYEKFGQKKPAAFNYSIIDMLGEEILVSDEENTDTMDKCEVSRNISILDDIEEKNDNENQEELDGSLAGALAVAASLDELSFLCSPSESTAPLKRFSKRRTGQKLEKLLNNLNTTEQQSDAEMFNEIDHLMINNKTSTEEPSGMQQLLTAEIQLNHSEILSCTPSQGSAAISINEKETTNWQEVYMSGVTYLVRESETTAPDYNAWTTEQLHKELAKFGVKALKSHQAIKILDHIYRMTHPFVLEDKKTTKKRVKKKSTATNII